MKNSIWFLVFVFLLSACQPATSVTSTATPYLSPVPSSTSAPTPSATPKIISGIQLRMIGKDTHGNMICMTNFGNLDGLDVKLTATIKNNGEIIESGIPLEVVEDSHCFEITDLMYQNGSILTVIIKPNRNPFVVGEFVNDLDPYVTVPFLRWIFGENGLTSVFSGFRDDHRQWDLSFESTEYPSSIGTPIYAIGDGVILLYNYWFPESEAKGYCTSLEAWLPDVGLLWQFGHTSPMEIPAERKIETPFSAGDLLTTIDKNQAACSSEPHTHTAYQTSLLSDPIRVAYDHPIDSYINPFSTDPMNDGSNLPTGLWLPEYLPKSVLVLFESDFF